MVSRAITEIYVSSRGKNFLPQQNILLYYYKLSYGCFRSTKRAGEGIRGVGGVCYTRRQKKRSFRRINKGWGIMVRFFASNLSDGGEGFRGSCVSQNETEGHVYRNWPLYFFRYVVPHSRATRRLRSRLSLRRRRDRIVQCRTGSEWKRTRRFGTTPRGDTGGERSSDSKWRMTKQSQSECEREKGWLWWSIEIGAKLSFVPDGTVGREGKGNERKNEIKGWERKRVYMCR